MLIEHAKSQLLLVDLQERLLPVMADPAGISHRIGILLTAARQLGVPVLASEQYPAGLGATVSEIRSQLNADEILTKTEFSCCANPALGDRLQKGADQVVIAGIEAHVCVLQTALDLVAAGREVYVVADAVSARSPDSKAIALQRLVGKGATVVTTEMVLFEWLRRADRAEFKSISHLIR